MSTFSASLYCLPDNRAVAAHLISMELTCSLDSPARGLSACFVCEEGPGEISELHLYKDTAVIFTGRVDKQRTTLGENGITLRVECRSEAAVLLDNEALPHVYLDVGVSTLFSRCIAAYGFTCANIIPEKLLPVYTVRKGISQWQAFCGFTERVYSLTSFVRGNRVHIEKPPLHNGIILSNTGHGIAFSNLEYSFIPYNIISEVMIRDGAGYYSTGVKNLMASYYGVKRRRYMAPASELADSARQDADSRIRASMSQRVEIKVTIPEIVSIETGQAVAVTDTMLERYNLMVNEWAYKVDATGVFTLLTLVRAEV